MLLKDTLSTIVAYLCLSFIEEPYNNTLTWKIERFSTLDEEYYYSQEFIVGDSKWKLKVHPKGDSIVEKRAISVYLWLCDCLPTEQNVFAEYKLRIRDQIKGKHKEKRAEDWFPSSDGWGYPEFLLLKDLNNASKGFLVNDTVLVEAEIIVMSKLK
nr:MATH domain and coiled-coil domain-containing protein At3g58260-like [Quercus suber]